MTNQYATSNKTANAGAIIYKLDTLTPKKNS